MVLRHVEQTERPIVQQRAVIGRLPLHGLSVDSAENMLAVLEKFQDLHIEHRDRLQIMLDNLSPQLAT